MEPLLGLWTMSGTSIIDTRAELGFALVLARFACTEWDGHRLVIHRYVEAGEADDVLVVQGPWGTGIGYPIWFTEEQG